MSLGFKICLASDASGTVTLQGGAVKGAIIKRKVVWNDKEYFDDVSTDDKGKFALPALYARSLFKHMPIQPTLPQEVSISYKGETHLGWALVKMDWDELSEINSGKAVNNKTALAFNVSCELSDGENTRYAPDSLCAIHGKCHLDGE